MKNVTSLEFTSVNHMLEELNATDEGRYYLCDCPECKQHEAFVYKKNIGFIQCNRDNKCGVKINVKFHEKSQTYKLKKEAKRVEDEAEPLTENQKSQIEWLTKFLTFQQEHGQNPELEEYRGLSRKTTSLFSVDLMTEKNVKLMFSRIPDLLKKDYSNSSFMTKRNIIFFIKNKENKVDYILLRSTIDPEIKKKEIQLSINPLDNAKIFFHDIPKNATKIVYAESIIDAASFREIDENVGIVGLTGNRKTQQLLDFIKENPDVFKDKLHILALDNDEAGREAHSKIEKVLSSEGHEYTSFNYLEGIKDPNEFLQKDRLKFEDTYFGILGEKEKEKKMVEVKENGNKNLEVKINNMTYLKDQDRALVSIQYGELLLNNITVEEYKDSVLINYPRQKGGDDVYRDVYVFNDDPKYNHDKRMIEGALVKNFYELKHGLKEEVKKEPINITIKDDITPKILRSYTFQNGNKSVNVAYKSLIINNVIVGKSNGKEYVGFPYYKKNENEIKNYVSSFKSFSEKLLKGVEEKNKKNELEK